VAVVGKAQGDRREGRPRRGSPKRLKGLHGRGPYKGGARVCKADHGPPRPVQSFPSRFEELSIRGGRRLVTGGDGHRKGSGRPCSARYMVAGVVRDRLSSRARPDTAGENPLANPSLDAKRELVKFILPSVSSRAADKRAPLTRAFDEPLALRHYILRVTSHAPAPIIAIPSQLTADSRSPRNSTPNTATSTTLNLSRGATRAASARLRARK
jgi:hypothetical protein